MHQHLHHPDVWHNYRDMKCCALRERIYHSFRKRSTKNRKYRYGYAHNSYDCFIQKIFLFQIFLFQFQFLPVFYKCIIAKFSIVVYKIIYRLHYRKFQLYIREPEQVKDSVTAILNSCQILKEQIDFVY